MALTKMEEVETTGDPAQCFHWSATSSGHSARFEGPKLRAEPLCLSKGNAQNSEGRGIA